MNATAGIEAVLGSRRTPIRSLFFLLLWAIVAFGFAGMFGNSLGGWTPDPGVILMIGLVARARPTSLWSAALAVSAGRVAVGIDPPLAIATIYLGIAGIHSGLCGLADGNRAIVRLIGAALYAAIAVVGLIAVHESRSFIELGLLEQAPSIALRTAISTSILTVVLSPVLGRVPGLGEWRERR